MLGQHPRDPKAQTLARAEEPSSYHIDSWESDRCIRQQSENKSHQLVHHEAIEELNGPCLLRGSCRVLRRPLGQLLLPVLLLPCSIGLRLRCIGILLRLVSLRSGRALLRSLPSSSRLCLSGLRSNSHRLSFSLRSSLSNALRFNRGTGRFLGGCLGL